MEKCPRIHQSKPTFLSEANIVDALTEDNDLETIRLNITFKNLSKIDSKEMKRLQMKDWFVRILTLLRLK